MTPLSMSTTRILLVTLSSPPLLYRSCLRRTTWDQRRVTQLAGGPARGAPVLGRHLVAHDSNLEADLFGQPSLLVRARVHDQHEPTRRLMDLELRRGVGSGAHRAGELERTRVATIARKPSPRARMSSALPVSVESAGGTSSESRCRWNGSRSPEACTDLSISVPLIGLAQRMRSEARGWRSSGDRACERDLFSARPYTILEEWRMTLIQGCSQVRIVSNREAKTRTVRSNKPRVSVPFPSCARPPSPRRLTACRPAAIPRPPCLAWTPRPAAESFPPRRPSLAHRLAALAVQAGRN